jgi:hypothetical protein
MKRRPLTKTLSFEQRLEAEARRLRKEAQGTPQGVEREKLLRRAKQAETAVHMRQWLKPPGLHPPD